MRVAVEKLDGVEDAVVSLNEGRVRVRLAPGSRVTVAELRRTIRNQGFSPREATLTVSAWLENRSGVLVAFVPGSNVSFSLVPGEAVRARLTNGAGTTLVLQGRLEKDEDGVTPDRLHVTGVGGGPY